MARYRLTLFSVQAILLVEVSSSSSGLHVMNYGGIVSMVVSEKTTRFLCQARD